MDYKEQIDRLRSEISELENSELAVELFDGLITDLLARAEAAESRCETLEKMVKEYQDTIVPGYRERAEKAERERDAAVKDLEIASDCRTCGNVSPWCIENPDKCKGYKWRGQKEE